MDAPISYFLITTDKFLFKMDTTSSVFFTRHFFTTILELFKILLLLLVGIVVTLRYVTALKLKPINLH